MLCGHISTFLINFTLDFRFVLRSDGAWSLGSQVVPSVPASHFSGGVLCCPFSCSLCLLVPPVGPGLGDQGVGSTSGACAPCQGQERAQAPVGICFRPANISSKGQAMGERKKLLSCNYNKGLAFLFCTRPCKLRSYSWLGCFEDWRTNRCKATGTMPDIRRCDRKVCRII